VKGKRSKRERKRAGYLEEMFSVGELFENEYKRK
jgi:hypothetical protein